MSHLHEATATSPAAAFPPEGDDTQSSSSTAAAAAAARSTLAGEDTTTTSSSSPPLERHDIIVPDDCTGKKTSEVSSSSIDSDPKKQTGNDIRKTVSSQDREASTTEEVEDLPLLARLLNHLLTPGSSLTPIVWAGFNVIILCLFGIWVSFVVALPSNPHVWVFGFLGLGLAASTNWLMKIIFSEGLDFASQQRAEAAKLQAEKNRKMVEETHSEAIETTETNKSSETIETTETNKSFETTKTTETNKSSETIETTETNKSFETTKTTETNKRSETIETSEAATS